MSDDPAKVEALCKEILESVLSRLRESFLALPDKLGDATGRTRESYEKAAHNLESAFEIETEREVQRRLSQAEFAASRLIADSRRAEIEKLLAAGFEKALAGWEENKSELTTRFIIEAIEELDGDEFVVHIDPPLDDRRLRIIEESVTESLDRKVTLDSALPLEEQGKGGLVVVTRDGHQLFDNSLQDRFRRNLDGLRAACAALTDEEVSKA